MKRTVAFILALAMILALCAGCGDKGDKPNIYDDGRARPSSCGKLQVKDGKLCSQDGEPVMLRGVSFLMFIALLEGAAPCGYIPVRSTIKK